VLDVGGTKGVSRVQSVKDGALLTFEIRAWPDDPTKERLDRGHKGPCAVYLKKVDDAATDKAVGDGWFKIFDHGYNNSTKRWCTDEIIDNNGLLSVHLPKGMEGGDYLARPEIIALHAANVDDPQPYTGCAQIFLESSGNLVPESTVSIPGYMKYGTPSTHFDIYNTDGSEYIIPGPPVAKLAPKGVQAASTTQTDGKEPEGCIMENANWCGKEVPDYSDETGCWASQEDCWSQSKVCYATSPPTGHKGCDLWQKKCQALQDACTAGKFTGPPNKGKVLTPVKKAIDVGLSMATVGGGVDDAPTSTKKAGGKTSSQAKATPTAEVPVESAKPTTTADAKTSDSYDSPPLVESSAASAKSSSAYDAPVSTITVAPSSANAPAPTEKSCPKGWKCITETQVEVVTETVYITATAGSDNGYKKRSTVHARRLRRA
jgi:hypothetical protein